MAEDSDKELLALLQAHGQSFLSSFGLLPESTSHQPSRKRRKVNESDISEPSAEAVVEDGERMGSGSESSAGMDSEDDDVSDDLGGDDAEDYDDDFRSDQSSKKQPEVVVFSDTSRVQDAKMSKSLAKAFMSSKVSKLRQGVDDTRTAGENEEDDGVEEERTNLQNDKLLHKLVHTQLLSGSLNSELNLTPAQRRKALEGRVLELAASAKLGKGESAVRQEERKKAAQRVRLGLERKVEERRRKAVEEAKDLGNYHRSIKHLFEADSKKRPDRRKRDRGLKLGVGKFSGGVLKLRRDDIASLQGPAGPSRGGKPGGRKASYKRRS